LHIFHIISYGRKVSRIVKRFGKDRRK
jgi:hypothetical protein